MADHVSNDDVRSIVAALSPAASSLQGATNRFRQISKLCPDPRIAPEFAAVVSIVRNEATYCGHTLFPECQLLVRGLKSMLTYYTSPQGVGSWELNINTIVVEAAQHHAKAVWVAAQCQIVAANVKVAESHVPGARQAMLERAAAFKHKRKVQNVKAFVKKGTALGTGLVSCALAIPTFGVSLVLLPSALALEVSGVSSSAKAVAADINRADCESACAALDGTFSAETARFHHAMIQIGKFFALLEHEARMYSELAGRCSREAVRRRQEKHWYKMQGKAAEILRVCAALNKTFAASISGLKAIR